MSALAILSSSKDGALLLWRAATHTMSHDKVDHQLLHDDDVHAAEVEGVS